MSLNGGYLVVNLRGYALTSGEASAIEGISQIIVNPYNKPTLISGLIVGDVEYPDFYAPFISNGNNHVSNVTIGSKAISISIDSDDNVTVTVA